MEDGDEVDLLSLDISGWTWETLRLPAAEDLRVVEDANGRARLEMREIRGEEA